MKGPVRLMAIVAIGMPVVTVLACALVLVAQVSLGVPGRWALGLPVALLLLPLARLFLGLGSRCRTSQEHRAVRTWFVAALALGVIAYAIFAVLLRLTVASSVVFLLVSVVIGVGALTVDRGRPGPHADAEALPRTR